MRVPPGSASRIARQQAALSGEQCQPSRCVRGLADYADLAVLAAGQELCSGFVTWLEVGSESCQNILISLRMCAGHDPSCSTLQLPLFALV